MLTPSLPKELSLAIASETKDFAFKTGRGRPLVTSYYSILFGVIWIVGSIFVAFIYFWTLFQGKQINHDINGVPTTASPDNLSSIVLPLILIGVGLLIGFLLLSPWINTFTKEGGYFVGTPTRLIHYQNGKIKYIGWDEFTGHIEVKGNGRQGSISLTMRTGATFEMKHGHYGPTYATYAPNVLYLSNVPNVFNVKQICRRRIAENNPNQWIPGDDNEEAGVG